MRSVPAKQEPEPEISAKMHRREGTVMNHMIKGTKFTTCKSCKWAAWNMKEKWAEATRSQHSLTHSSLLSASVCSHTEGLKREQLRHTKSALRGLRGSGVRHLMIINWADIKEGCDRRTSLSLNPMHHGDPVPNWHTPAVWPKQHYFIL